MRLQSDYNKPTKQMLPTQCLSLKGTTLAWPSAVAYVSQIARLSEKEALGRDAKKA